MAKSHTKQHLSLCVADGVGVIFGSACHGRGIPARLLCSGVHVKAPSCARVLAVHPFVLARPPDRDCTPPALNPLRECVDICQNVSHIVRTCRVGVGVNSARYSAVGVGLTVRYSAVGLGLTVPRMQRATVRVDWCTARKNTGFSLPFFSWLKYWSSARTRTQPCCLSKRWRSHAVGV